MISGLRLELDHIDIDDREVARRPKRVADGATKATKAGETLFSEVILFGSPANTNKSRT